MRIVAVLFLLLGLLVPRAFAKIEGPGKYCKGTWGTTVKLSRDETKMIVRAPGYSSVEVPVTKKNTDSEPKTYVYESGDESVVLTLAKAEGKSSLVFHGGRWSETDGTEWPLNLGCSTVSRLEDIPDQSQKFVTE